MHGKDNSCKTTGVRFQVSGASEQKPVENDEEERKVTGPYVAAKARDVAARRAF